MTDWPNLVKSTKRHIYRSRAFHWYQNQMSGPPRFRDIARTRKRCENPYFWPISANLTMTDWPNLAKSTKRHIYRSRAFHWYPNQMSVPLRFRDIGRTRKRCENTYFWQISANLTMTDWPNLVKSTKRHIYMSRAFHRYQYQMCGPSRFRDIARTRKR